MIWLRFLAGLAAMFAALGAWLLVADLMRSVI
jgi:hypothetical protein